MISFSKKKKSLLKCTRLMCNLNENYELVELRIKRTSLGFFLGLFFQISSEIFFLWFVAAASVSHIEFLSFRILFLTHYRLEY